MFCYLCVEVYITVSGDTDCDDCFFVTNMVYCEKKTQYVKIIATKK